MPEIITATHTSESQHWYRIDGTPAYTYIDKKGNEKPTTLREARKETPHLVPSTTMILRLADKPQLTEWKINQAILSALTCPRIDGESETAYLSRIKSDAREQAKKAAERGTVIHAWVQQGFDGDCPPEGVPFFESAIETVEKECGDQWWICEKSFATDKYGGKCDLHSDEYLLDVKTVDKDLSTLKTWEEHHMQLAAYDNGILNSTFPSGRKCGILYVHQFTAESRVVWVTAEELHKGWKMFSALLNYWYAKTGL
jgi:hypothetical protein